MGFGRGAFGFHLDEGSAETLSDDRGEPDGALAALASQQEPLPNSLTGSPKDGPEVQVHSAVDVSPGGHSTVSKHSMTAVTHSTAVQGGGSNAPKLAHQHRRTQNQASAPNEARSFTLRHLNDTSDVASSEMISLSTTEHGNEPVSRGGYSRIQVSLALIRASYQR